MTGSKEIFEEMREAELHESYSPNTIDTVFHLPPTKLNVEMSANRLITAIKEGKANPFEILSRMEAVKLFCDQVRDGVNDHVRAELEKYGKEGHRALDAKFELAEVGVKYFYEKDPVWSAFNTELDAIKEKIKEQEKFLKVLSKPLNEVQDTGEVVERMPPYKTSKSSFKITLAK